MKKRTIWIIVIIVAGIIGLAIYHWATGVPWPDWTGFSDYTGPLTKDQRGKTLWDWMGLLIIPLVLAIGAFLFNRSEKANELKIADRRRKDDQELAEKRYRNDQEIAIDQQREESLQNYIDKMTELLLENNLLSSQTGDKVRAVARTRTLATLRRLDSVRKGILLSFLYEAGLINTGNSIVGLIGADLKEVRLDNVILIGAELEAVNLKGAHLNGAILERTRFIGTDLRNALLNEADLRNADMINVDLTGAHLKGAILCDTRMDNVKLKDAYLTDALLNGAILDDGNLSGAHLIGTNLKGARLIRANLDGAEFQNAILEDAIMPDGKKYDPSIHHFTH
jgi:uncharacterized protein YjbI with pentapeptide repeats